jgi:hypothetical protein
MFILASDSRDFRPSEAILVHSHHKKTIPDLNLNAHPFKYYTMAGLRRGEALAA